MDAYWWCGLIGVLVSGWALSSYASNFSYRLPRREEPFGKKPYCGDCNALLEPKDLFPIFSFLMTDGKCRHCGSIIPSTYYILELIFPLLFLAAYVHFGFGDLFLLTAFAGAALVVLSIMALDDGFFSAKTLLFIALLGVGLKALVLHSISDALMGSFIGFLVATAYYRQRTVAEFDIKALPTYVWLAAALGCWFPLADAILIGAGWLLLWRILRYAKSLSHVAISAPVLSFAVLMLAGIFLVY